MGSHKKKNKSIRAVKRGVKCPKCGYIHHPKGGRCR